MADRVAAVHAWLETALGVPCHEEGRVPTTARMPYATHRIPAGGWGDPQSAEVDVWCEPGRAEQADGIVARLYSALGLGGEVVPCDGGAAWLTRGAPFAQPVADERGERRYCNVDIEYLTSD